MNLLILVSRGNLLAFHSIWLVSWLCLVDGTSEICYSSPDSVVETWENKKKGNGLDVVFLELFCNRFFSFALPSLGSQDIRMDVSSFFLQMIFFRNVNLSYRTKLPFILPFFFPYY